MDLDSFAKTLETHCPEHPVSRQDAADGFHNLSGFMSLLIRVNEREQIIPTKQIGLDDENQ
ncbi:MAG: hypothetical protein H6860_05220 [Rhodospirillales bacterium]|nr:hypothetical protein [Alphaproteobacteria bacterium]MCB9981782.1 hypothetical protein [Rhodospirillales bacterium]